MQTQSKLASIFAFKILFLKLVVLAAVEDTLESEYNHLGILWGEVSLYDWSPVWLDLIVQNKNISCYLYAVIYQIQPSLTGDQPYSDPYTLQWVFCVRVFTSGS